MIIVYNYFHFKTLFQAALFSHACKINASEIDWNLFMKQTYFTTTYVSDGKI